MRFFKLELSELKEFPNETNHNPEVLKVVDSIFVTLSDDALEKMAKDPRHMDKLINSNFGVPALKMAEKIVLPQEV